MSEPMCGLASHRISRGAPASTKVSRIRRWAGFLVPVLSFPVREGPRAAQAKLDIALGVEDTLLKKEVNRLRAAKCRVTTLDEQGLEDRFGEGKRSEEAGASGADNDRTLLGASGAGEGE